MTFFYTFKKKTPLVKLVIGHCQLNKLNMFKIYLSSKIFAFNSDNF